ncbi:MAG: hypothetical protein QXV69_03900 [Sulfolobaceae archaeon]
MRLNNGKGKYYAIANIDELELPENIIKSDFHEHISNAVDEVLNKIRNYLSKNGIIGKFHASVNVFTRDDISPRLIQTINTKIVVKNNLDDGKVI